MRLQPSTEEAALPGYELTKDELLKRLRRIEGQVRGVTAMVEDDRYCIDVLTQISAIRSALESVAIGLVDDHVRHCVADAIAEGGPKADERLTEATTAIARLLKS
jgi:DNA-binding FrmR family transcriptional regulator